jgi:hypothetical protein
MLQHVNIKIVNALLTLRGVSLGTLSGVTGISQDALSVWLDGTNKEDDDRLPFDRQLEVLKVLGIVGENPRSDITHHWSIHEPFSGQREAAYEPLSLMLKCFGKAEILHLAPQEDKLFSFKSKTHFGLTFRKFRAVLEITTHPLQSLSFNPVSLPNLTWAGSASIENNAGTALVLDEAKFRQLTAPGESTPTAFDKERVQALEYLLWNKLTMLADERGVGASDLAVLLIEKVPTRVALPSAKKPAAITQKLDSPQPLPNEAGLSSGVASGPSGGGKARRVAGVRRKRAGTAPSASPTAPVSAPTGAALPAQSDSGQSAGK